MLQPAHNDSSCPLWRARHIVGPRWHCRYEAKNASTSLALSDFCFSSNSGVSLATGGACFPRRAGRSLIPGELHAVARKQGSAVVAAYEPTTGSQSAGSAAGTSG
jgi:hypothetical protein